MVCHYQAGTGPFRICTILPYCLPQSARHWASKGCILSCRYGLPQSTRYWASLGCVPPCRNGLPQSTRHWPSTGSVPSCRNGLPQSTRHWPSTGGVLCCHNGLRIPLIPYSFAAMKPALAHCQICTVKTVRYCRNKTRTNQHWPSTVMFAGLMLQEEWSKEAATQLSPLSRPSQMGLASLDP